MYIDDCRHEFAELAATVLPTYMARLQCSLEQPWPASLFSERGKGTVSVTAQLGKAADFSGCYVLVDGEKPIYVGISRGVINRLRQHMLGSNHFSASLAYSMAQRQLPMEGVRNDMMKIPTFRAEFDKRQEYLRSLFVGTVEIGNPLVLHVFEAYASMSLKTSDWNTFRTH